jgi:hypothetical protein
MDLLMGDDALRARLAEAARRNVRRFERERVMAMWDDLLGNLRPGTQEQAAVGAMRPRSQTP